ncbi:hypothetical protein JHN55_07060 [Streptomyces sp. MBT56]|uniref:hypothetical protein n=1 Tax=unclassified Streptomyces TaxID=2593676 RepID=UPI001909CB60|nr:MULTISPECIES: hypothetical protein [unclassified Streptomyces]MBK3556298.1 hypothetical protein [Streptomyces sp. MBT56]MBK3601236.1 hypothetical protein [Streptomyces sp. MBT54]MBK3614528.1 hypothetical protein [Streptomyces sp. MBT98]MBK6042827.1 hypothetical protein [Streptomyces sp. MBT55]
MAVQRCVESFTVWRGGVPITFTAGQLLEEKHPILKTHGHLFQDVATAARPRQAQRVEAAVNDPGTARALTPPAETKGSPDPDTFDPTQHVTKDVLAYLDTVGETEALRVLDAEATGENRTGIRKVRDQILEDARARDAASE